MLVPETKLICFKYAPLKLHILVFSVLPPSTYNFKYLPTLSPTRAPVESIANLYVVAVDVLV
jgi:hypothetical protein